MISVSPIRENQRSERFGENSVVDATEILELS
jgi:hypothetical protein